MKGARVEAARLTVSYLGRDVLEDVDLAVAPGEFVAVVGPSGAGKSTLLRAVAGLLPPRRGRLALITEDGTPARVAVVFQEPRLLPWLSVADNVALVLAGTAAERRRRALDALAAVGLAAHGDAWPRQLSGGMAQRAALARALAREPHLLLLDEPFSAVDALTRLQLQGHLLELWQRRGFTAVLVTHDIDEALFLADRVLVLGGQPGGVRAVLSVPGSRPRDRGNPGLAPLRARLLATLGAATPPTGPLQATTLAARS